MTLIRFEPLRELENWNERVQKFFGDFPGTHELGTAFNPNIDISEDEKNIIVEAEIPGVKKEEIKISVEDNILTISGEKRSVEKEENKEKNYFRNEIGFGTFRRSFTLPEEINPETAEAKFENGILKVTLQKQVKKQANNRFIDIK